MSLKDLNLKVAYDSDEDDILNEFYIPALSESIIYKRLAGYFTSSSFAIAAKGLAKFISNGGKIQLIANVILSKEDYEKIKEVSEKPFLKKAEKEFIESLENIEDELIRDHVKMLGWMLKNGKLEIKISLVAEGGGIQHQKTGILEDGEGNTISFTGSDNETKRGWIDNIESFHVFCNWKEDEKEHIESDIKKFGKFWDDKAKRAKIYPVSEAVNKNLIRIAPENDREFEKLSGKVVEELFKRRRKEVEERNKNTKKVVIELELREYQKEAVANWFKNDCVGFFRMATGTGKTETAIGVIKELIGKEKSPLFVIIAVHGNSLLKQWIDKLKKYGYFSKGASSDFQNWMNDFKNDMLEVSLGYKNLGIFVTTYQTFSSKKFIDIAKTIECKTLLICDEVHHAGAPDFREGLIEKYDLRLGLSATPDRWFDEEGTKFINDYFGKTVYVFSMKRAMREINPLTGKTFLCHYNYYPILVDLTSEENEEFISLSREMAKRCRVLGKYDINDIKLRSLSLKRADIKKNAILKIVELDGLLKGWEEKLQNCIIYCSGKQMGDVKRLLRKYKVVYHEFTQHQDSETRQKLLEGFALGKKGGGWGVLLAIDCLNEGIDVPSARIGIFLENSSNPIEFIQRRGRLLRQNNEKTNAEAYDFIVQPDFEEIDEKNFLSSEKKEMQKEFDRFIEFARLASNTQEALNTMEKLISKYDLVINIREEEL